MLRGGRARAVLAASVAKLLLLTVKTPLFVPGYGIYVSIVVIKDFTHFSYISWIMLNANACFFYSITIKMLT